MIISINAKKAYDKIQHTFIIKTLIKLRREGNFFNLIKEHLRKTQSEYHAQQRKTERFPLEVRKKKSICSHHFYLILYQRGEPGNKVKKIE